MLPLSHINLKFLVDGETFSVEDFKIDFEQPVDYKGQPQHEIGGGQMTVQISQIPTNGLYSWAKTSTATKSGTVLFQTDMGITVLEINFTNAYCVNLIRQINAYSGTNTVLVLSPEKIKINGTEHNNFWPK